MPFASGRFRVTQVKSPRKSYATASRTRMLESGLTRISASHDATSQDFADAGAGRKQNASATKNRSFFMHSSYHKHKEPAPDVFRAGSKGKQRFSAFTIDSRALSG